MTRDEHTREAQRRNQDVAEFVEATKRKLALGRKRLEELAAQRESERRPPGRDRDRD